MAPMTRKRKSDQNQALAAAAEPTEPPKETKRQKKLPVRARDEDSATAAPKQGKLMVFDDADDADDAAAPAPVSTVKETPAVAAEAEGSEQEDEDSDDEAPEAVSTQKAAKDVKQSAKVAQQAAKEQATAQKRKRQQRDAMLKQQAEERKKAVDEVSDSEAEAEDEELAEDAPGKEDGTSMPEEKDVQRPGAPSDRRRKGKVGLPALLPEEFLTDSSSDEEGDGDEEDGAGVKTKPKRRKVATAERNLARLDKAMAPRDVVAGSTVYRVAKKTDERMAPKARKHSKSSKQLLLKRNRPTAKPRGGFFTS